MVIPSGGSDGLTVDVDTTIPEYIMEDHINLTGTTDVTYGSWVETSNADFLQGTSNTVSVSGGSVLLGPSLSFSILNGGAAVLKGGTGSDWDTVIISSVSVIKVNSTFYMYFVGSRGSSLMDARHIGVATSSDGISWTKYSSNPILKSRVNSYDWTNLNDPRVVYVNGTWHMWYSGNHGNQNPSQMHDLDLCYANSSDGYNWTKSSSNPVMANGFANWAMSEVRSYDVQWNGSAFIIYYKGRTAGAGATSWLALATSTDGITWTQDSNNPLRRGDQNGWEDGEFLGGTRETANGTHRMWTWGDMDKSKLGWIWSSDGIDWEDSGSAVLSPQANTIYAQHLRHPIVYDRGDDYILWVKCWDGSGTRTVGAFKVTQKDLTGSYLSRRFGAGGVVNVTDISWNGTILGGGTGNTAVTEGGRFVVSLRWSNTTSSWSSWRRLDPDDDMKGLKASYFQYKVEFDAEQDWFRVRFDDFSLSYATEITSVEIQVDGSPWEPANGDLRNWWLNLSLHDGDYDVRVRVNDSVDGQVVRTIPVKVDLFAPTGSILIEDGKYAHNATWVKIDVAANDTHEPIEMQMSRTPDFSQATWWPHYPSNTYGLLDEPEGNVTIYLRLRDAAGRISETYNDTIVIDTTPPEGMLLINDGDKYTNDTTVTLSWTATDLTGVVGMMASNDPDFEGAIWEDPMNAFSWAIGETDGVHTVYLKIIDFVGWETVLTDDIILDRTPPAASLSIDQDARYTTSPDVTLNITLYDVNPISYKLINPGDDWPDSWRATGSPVDIPWTLSSGPDGQRSVRMLVRDAAGNEFIAADDIILDTTPPDGELVINDSAPFPNMLLVTATLTASDATSGLDRMRISNADDFGDAPWQSVRDSFQWPLPSGDGPKNLFVQLRDMAGLVSTVDASIILDTTAPTGTVAIAGVGPYSRSPSVELAIDIQDGFGLDAMMVSADEGFTDAIWVPYSTVYPWDLGDTDGLVTAYVRVRDLAGNAFTTSVSTILDTTPPVVSADVPFYSLSRTVDFTGSASDAVGLESTGIILTTVLGILLEETHTFLNGVTSIEDEAGMFEITEEMTEGGHDSYEFILVVWAKDLAGWQGQQQFTVTYIPEVPKGAVSIDDGAEWTNSTTVTVRMTHTGGLTPTHFRYATTEAGLWEQSGWAVLLESFTIELNGQGGPQTVFCVFKGLFDIESEIFSDDIKLDVIQPEIVIVTPTATNTEGGSTRFSVSVSDDQDPEPVVQFRLNDGPWRPYTVEERLSLKEGDNLIEVMATDDAGNVDTAEWTIRSDSGVSVSGTSWLILVVILVVAALVGVWYWRIRQTPEED
jgi:hypothetical protein